MTPAAARFLRPAVLLAAAIMALWIGVRATLPPVPLPDSASPTLFSAGRAMADVRAIAMRPHPAGTLEDEKVAAYLMGRLEGLGLRVEQHRYLADEATSRRLAEWSGGTVAPIEISNVVGILPGRDPAKPALLVMAHHDTVWGSPGAPDDSMGVAAAIEIARAIGARGRPERDVVLLFTDAEETGLNGARAFWAGGGLASRIGVCVDLESRGGGGRAIMFETGRNAGGMMRLFGRAVARPSANSMAAYAYRRTPNNTDFSIPRDRGVPGFNFANLGRPRYYHSPLATIDRLDPRTLQDIGGQALDLAAALAFARALPAPAPDLTYFDLPGGRFVRYPAGAGWLPLAGAALLLGVAWRRARPGARDVAAGAGLLVWVGAAGFLLVESLNLLSGAGPDANYYDRLAALPRLEWQAALALLAVLAAAAGLRRPSLRLLGALPGFALLVIALRLGVPGGAAWPAGLVAMAVGVTLPPRPGAPRDEWLGMIALLVVAGLVVQAKAAQVSWLIGWPALVLAAVAAAGTPVLAAGIGAALVTAALIPVAHLAFLALGAPHPVVALPFALLIGVAFWPLTRAGRTPAAPIAAASALLALAALALAIGVRVDPLAPSVPGYSVK